MAKHLTDKDINNVTELLDDWPTDAKLTWEKLVEAVKHELNFTTTRQTLQKQARIKVAYAEVKAIVSGNVSQIKLSGKSLPPSLKVAADRLEKQQRTIERLEHENQRLLEQFHTWLYNATQQGISIEQLNAPLPSKD